MKSPEDALASLVQIELGLGGVPTCLRLGADGVVIQVTTSTATLTDVMEFSGSHDEMELLVEAVRIWRTIAQCPNCSPEPADIARLIYLELLEVKSDADTKLFADLTPQELHRLVCLKQNPAKYEKVLSVTA